MAQEETFFDFAATVGLTKHFGGVEATDEMARLCHIGEGSNVLDVGCGAGVTPCYLARVYGCRVVGVDISEGMVARSRERATKERLSDRVSFRVADAQDLPFEDATFDAVLTESVTAFPKDKQAAVSEYARVTRPGGYVGLNESTWLKAPPPPEMIAWASQDVGATVMPLTREGWEALLDNAGLEDIVTRMRGLDTRDETRGILRRYGCTGMLNIAWRGLSLYLRNPAYRRFVSGVREGGLKPKDLDVYFGYGMYIGRKPQA